MIRLSDIFGLSCTICWDSLTFDECALERDGSRWDSCIRCGGREGYDLVDWQIFYCFAYENAMRMLDHNRPDLAATFVIRYGDYLKENHGI